MEGQFHFIQFLTWGKKRGSWEVGKLGSWEMKGRRKKIRDQTGRQLSQNNEDLTINCAYAIFN
jgi:hypothetical protein